MNIPLTPPFKAKVRGVPTEEVGAAEQRLLLHDIRWDDYLDIGDALIDRPGLRMTYDRGSLELMTTSPEYEWFKKRLGRLLEALAEEFGGDIETLGNMTFRSERLKRGLEPDDCFWFAHEPVMRSRAEWDPEKDPPPDLVLEIEISHSALDRMGIYAALGVPEVWRFNGESLWIETLQPDGSYQPADESRSFPGLPLGELPSFVQRGKKWTYLGMVREFRKWVRSHRARKKRGKKRKPGGSE